MTLPLVSILVFIALVAYAVVLEMRKRYAATEEACVHDLKIIDVKPVGGYSIYGSAENTVVLERCHCGFHSTGIYAGHWSLEDFLRTENDVEVLERVAR